MYILTRKKHSLRLKELTMVAIHIEHKLDTGVLTISFVKIEVAPFETDVDCRPAEIFQFRFECESTGAWFDADMNHAEFIKICPILGEYDELLDTLNEPPNVTRGLDQNMITATFTAAGRKRSYPIAISLTKRAYAPDKQDIMELRAENAVLRRKVASLEETVLKHSGDIAFLAHSTLKCFSNAGRIGESKGLSRLFNSVNLPISIEPPKYRC